MVAKHQHHPNASNWGRNSVRPAAGELFRCAPQHPCASVPGVPCRPCRGGCAAGFTLARACRDITAPTLILKQDDQGATREQNIAVAALLSHPASKLVHVQGAGHNVRRDQKERALAALLPFLEGV